MITINNLYKNIEGSKILNGINLELHKKEIQVIFGKNGVGKTTLLKCISGLLKPDTGQINFDFEKENNIGISFGNSLLINKLTVKEYLNFVCNLKQISLSESKKEIYRLIAKLNLEEDKNKYIEKLSKGNKSKVSFLSAIISNPKFIVLDEPFSGMDLITSEQAIDLIIEKRDLGSTILISTHKADLLQSFVDKVSILKNGLIDKCYTITELENILKTRQTVSLYSFLKDQI